MTMVGISRFDAEHEYLPHIAVTGPLNILMEKHRYQLFRSLTTLVYILRVPIGESLQLLVL